MKSLLKLLTAVALTALAPSPLFACAACYGKSDSALATGMNWGIFTLLGVILTVLTCITIFFVHIVRKEQAGLHQVGTEAAQQRGPTIPTCRSSARARRSPSLPGFRESTSNNFVRGNL
jgi:hypothetical protein